MIDRNHPEYAISRRYRRGKEMGFRCPACSDKYWSWEGLKRHMAKMHHPCRFCVRAYIRVDQHERRSHTIEWARAAGACKAVTQTTRILAHLQTHDSITPLEALDLFGCFRLAARISDLREAGYPIVTEWLTTSNGRRYARYRLVRVGEQMVVGL